MANYCKSSSGEQGLKWARIWFKQFCSVHRLAADRGFEAWVAWTCVGPLGLGGFSVGSIRWLTPPALVVSARWALGWLVVGEVVGTNWRSNLATTGCWFSGRCLELEALFLIFLLILILFFGFGLCGSWVVAGGLDGCGG